MGFIILLVICCALVILIMLGFIVYTIATGQFHALPKEIIITAIPSLILFLMFKFCKNSKNKVSEKMFKKKQMKKHRQRQMKVKKLQTFCIIVCQHIICLIYHWLTVTITLKFVLLKVKSLILQN